MQHTVWWLAWLGVAACNTSKPEPAPVPVTAPAEPAKPAAGSGSASLATIPAIDIAGFLSGGYHTTGNIPVVYADLDKKQYVLIGKSAHAELPFTAKPDELDHAFEAFFLAHQYAVNGIEPTDAHQKIMVDGKEMVVMQMGELLPEMPADLRAHFTPAQYDLLENTSPKAGYLELGKRVPLVYCGGYKANARISVVDKTGEHEMTLDKAKDAFAALRKLAH